MQRLVSLILISVVGLSSQVLAQSHDQTPAQEAKPRIAIISPQQNGAFTMGGMGHYTADLSQVLNEHGYATEVLMPYFFNMTAKPTATNESITIGLDYKNEKPQRNVRFSLWKQSFGANSTTFFRHEGRRFGMNYFNNSMWLEKKFNFYAPLLLFGESFGAVGRAQADYILKNNFDIVILNDWSSGIVAYYLHQAKLRGERVPKVLYAVHNIAYDVSMSTMLAKILGVDRKDFPNKRISFTEIGERYSDMIFTVSENYAQEIATPRFGEGHEKLIQEKTADNRVVGILNGIIPSKWDPSVPRPGLEDTFTAQDFSGKATGKARLQKELGLTVNADIPVYALTSRVVQQKGFSYLTGAIREMAKDPRPSQWIVTGDGEPQHIMELKRIAAAYPDRVVYKAFSSDLEKKLTRYSDFFVNTAWFEPSGLNQFFALANGTIPLVSEVGGLADSVTDGVNGLTFQIVPKADGKGYDTAKTRNAAVAMFRRSLDLYTDSAEINRMRVSDMSEDHSWENRLRNGYSQLFDYVLKEDYKTKPFAAPTARKTVRCENVAL